MSLGREAEPPAKAVHPLLAQKSEVEDKRRTFPPPDARSSQALCPL